MQRSETSRGSAPEAAGGEQDKTCDDHPGTIQEAIGRAASGGAPTEASPGSIPDRSRGCGSQATIDSVGAPVLRLRYSCSGPSLCRLSLRCDLCVCARGLSLVSPNGMEQDRRISIL
jgi:hypothetical protein